MFEVEKEYNVEPKEFPLKDFFDYKDNFIMRPPYQRKANIWDNRRRLTFLESICKRYYIPKVVLRKVRVGKNEVKHEIIDGQQRITTVMMFYDNDLRLPASLKLIDSDNVLVGRTYEELGPKQRQWFDKNLGLQADIITNIDDPSNPEHLRKASEIFWRLQQGEPLRFMETLHSRLYSSARNFVAKYADDISFDFEKYDVIYDNKDRHLFFARVLDMPNERMQHLAMLMRFLMFEFDDGPTDVGNESVEAFVEKYPVAGNNINDTSFETKPEVKKCLRHLNVFYEIFKDDPMIDVENGVKELKPEYFVLSLYLLLRRLSEYYVFTEKEKKLFREFVIDFHKRMGQEQMADMEATIFQASRQQDRDNVERRDLIMRAEFFKKNKTIPLKDGKRLFDEYQRIEIYRRDKGLCQQCLKEGLSEKESTVSWGQWDADHIKPWVIGGKTTTEQGQVLCRRHNEEKGASGGS